MQEQTVLAMVGAQRQARTPYPVGKAVLAAALVLDPEAAAARHEKPKNDRGVSVDQFQAAGTVRPRQHQTPPPLAALETQLRSSSTAPDLHDLATPDIAQRWDALPLARKRKVIALLVQATVDRVTQRNGRSEFDPNSVRITWRIC